MHVRLDRISRAIAARALIASFVAALAGGAGLAHAGTVHSRAVIAATAAHPAGARTWASSDGMHAH